MHNVKVEESPWHLHRPCPKGCRGHDGLSRVGLSSKIFSTRLRFAEKPSGEGACCREEPGFAGPLQRSFVFCSVPFFSCPNLHFRGTNPLCYFHTENVVWLSITGL